MNAGQVGAYLSPRTGSGLLVYRSIDLDETGQVVQATRSKLYWYYLYNASAGTRYVRFYNKATAPTGADTPLLTIPLPAGGGANVHLGPGIDFSAGLSLRATSAVADNDATAPGANDVIVNLGYC
jgi:hypothetical protein